MSHFDNLGAMLNQHQSWSAKSGGWLNLRRYKIAAVILEVVIRFRYVDIE